MAQQLVQPGEDAICLNPHVLHQLLVLPRHEEDIIVTRDPSAGNIAQVDILERLPR